MFPLQQFHQEDEAAPGSAKPPYEEFYGEFAPKIRGYLLRHMQNEQDAEDLHSEIFLYCFRNYEKYDPAKASLSTWVYLVTKSRYKNYLRDRRETADIEGMELAAEEGEDPAEKAAYVEELRRNMYGALMQMTERQRAIVIMRYFKNLSAEEIGLRLGITPNNVRVQLSRTLKKMQPYLDSYRA